LLLDGMVYGIWYVGGVAGVLIYGCMNDSLRTAATKATTTVMTPENN